MRDPGRLLSEGDTLEALLLRSLRNADPPETARDEVWRRIGAAAGVGAATFAAATPLAARLAAAAAATGTKAVAQSSGLAALKWIAVAATLAPAVGMGAHWVAISHNTVAQATSRTSSPQPVAVLETITPSRPRATEPVAEPVMVARDQPPSATSVVAAVRPGPAASSLDAESSLLKHAREKLENADPKGALDDVTLLAARFPRGELTQEREVVAIKALLAQGQRSLAATRTGDFLRSHPNSPYADALRQSIKP
jgi:outer membrane lipoprotein YfiO